jgi:hypothetical protein
LTKDELAKHIKSSSAGMIPHLGYVFKEDNADPWTCLIASHDPELTLWNKCDVVAKNVVTNQVHIYTSLARACSCLNLSLKNVGNIRHRKGKDHPYEGWIFYPLDLENYKSKKRL